MSEFSYSESTLRQQHKDILEAVTSEIRTRHYSIRTEQTYLQWITRFIGANGGKSLKEIGKQGMISEPFRNCWATPMFPPP
jgi:hypothetical protein